MTEIREAHFVLVHGSCHGAWCWYKVETQLRSEGHRVTALDLAACGINQKPLQEVHSCHDYFEPLLEFMTTLPLDEKVVLVGHSFGGVGLSLAMETFPEKISVAVSLFRHIKGEKQKEMEEVVNFTAEALASKLYQLSPSQDLTLATMSVRPHSLQVESDASERLIVSKEKYGLVPRVYIVADQDMILSEEIQRWMIQLNPPNDVKDLTLATMLVRPHSSQADTNASEILMVSKEKYGSVHRVYIVADQDMLLPEEIQRWMIQKNPPDDVKVIQGSDHMPMFSKPQELCSCLLAIAQQHC